MLRRQPRKLAGGTMLRRHARGTSTTFVSGSVTIEEVGGIGDEEEEVVETLTAAAHECLARRLHDGETLPSGVTREGLPLDVNSMLMCHAGLATTVSEMRDLLDDGHYHDRFHCRGLARLREHPLVDGRGMKGQRLVAIIVRRPAHAPALALEVDLGRSPQYAMDIPQEEDTEVAEAEVEMVVIIGCALLLLLRHLAHVRPDDALYAALFHAPFFAALHHHPGRETTDVDTGRGQDRALDPGQ